MKFKPVVTRVKLNPEQAVLFCDCYSRRRRYVPSGGSNAANSVCWRTSGKAALGRYRSTTSATSS